MICIRCLCIQMSFLGHFVRKSEQTCTRAIFLFVHFCIRLYYSTMPFHTVSFKILYTGMNVKKKRFYTYQYHSVYKDLSQILDVHPSIHPSVEILCTVYSDSALLLLFVMKELTSFFKRESILFQIAGYKRKSLTVPRVVHYELIVSSGMSLSSLDDYSSSSSSSVE